MTNLNYFEIMKFLVILCSIFSVCYGDPPRECPCDYDITLPLTRVGEKFYYIESNTQANWFSAMNFCNLHKMRLASIASEIENEDLKHHLKAIKFDAVGFWTSGSDFAKQGTWYWTSYGTRIAYTSWSPNEPNNNSGVEHCLEIYTAGDKLVWNDINCERLRPFICESWG